MSKAVKHSTDRILTSHAGSLPRPDDLLELVQAGGTKAFGLSGNAARLSQACLKAMVATTAHFRNPMEIHGTAATMTVPITSASM